MSRSRRIPRRLGVTLIEIMIVIAIIALASTGVMYSVGALTRTKLKAASMRMMAAARYARHRALTEGRTVRVVLDLDSDQMGIEESDARVMLNRRDGDDEEAPEVVNAWSAAEAMLADPDMPVVGSSDFRAITDEDGDPIARFELSPLESVTIVRFAVDHEPMLRERGRVAFYFFPNGTGERSYTELQDPRGNRITVEIEPLSGRGRIHGPDFDLEDLEERRPRDPG